MRPRGGGVTPPARRRTGEGPADQSLLLELLPDPLSDDPPGSAVDDDHDDPVSTLLVVPPLLRRGSSSANAADEPYSAGEA